MTKKQCKKSENRTKENLRKIKKISRKEKREILSEILCNAAENGRVIEVRDILEQYHDSINSSDLAGVMLNAMDAGHLDIIDLCIHYGYNDLNYCMINATSLKVIHHLVDKYQGDAKYLECALIIALNGGNMLFAKQIVDYAKDRNVIFLWDYVANLLLDKGDIRGASFCLTYAAQHLEESTRDEIKEERNRNQMETSLCELRFKD